MKNIIILASLILSGSAHAQEDAATKKFNNDYALVGLIVRSAAIEYCNCYYAMEKGEKFCLNFILEDAPYKSDQVNLQHDHRKNIVSTSNTQFLEFFTAQGKPELGTLKAVATYTKEKGCQL